MTQSQRAARLCERVGHIHPPGQTTTGRRIKVASWWRCRRCKQRCMYLRGGLVVVKYDRPPAGMEKLV